MKRSGKIVLTEEIAHANFASREKGATWDLQRTAWLEVWEGQGGAGEVRKVSGNQHRGAEDSAFDDRKLLEMSAESPPDPDLFLKRSTLASCIESGSMLSVKIQSTKHKSLYVFQTRRI